MKKFLSILVFSMLCIIGYAQNDSISLDDVVEYSDRAKAVTYDNAPVVEYDNGSTAVEYEPRYTYLEMSLGANIPTDGSDAYFGMSTEFGQYVNPILGVGLEFKYGWTTTSNRDGLGYIGVNTRYRLMPVWKENKIFDVELTAGLGYGWYKYDLGYYDYYDVEYYDYYWDEYGYDRYYYNEYEIYNYIVPKVGLNLYFKTSENFQLGIEPSFSWYISTNKDRSDNVGVFNIMAKFKWNI